MRGCAGSGNRGEGEEQWGYRGGAGDGRRHEMAGPVYKFWRMRYKGAWYQLSEEEQNAHAAKIEEALEKVGGKRVIVCVTV